MLSVVGTSFECSVVCCLVLLCVKMVCGFFFFFFKQKTAYEIGTGDWSSDVCSSDLNLSDN